MTNFYSADFGKVGDKTFAAILNEVQKDNLEYNKYVDLIGFDGTIKCHLL